MADPLIQAAADRYVRHLRKMFLKIGPVASGDEKLLDRCRHAVVRGLALEKAKRVKRRKKHEQTRDMFNDFEGTK